MKIFTYIKTHAVLASSLAILVVVVMVIGGRVAARKSLPSTASQNGLRQVTLVSASAFRSDLSSVAANGTVESVAQADLRSQTSAPVSFINASIGSSVSAGQVMIELKNADIRARLDQAKAALASARGGYQTGAVSLASVRIKAADESRNAYSNVDQVIRGQVDQFLFNSTGGVEPLSNRISDLKLQDRVHGTRYDLTGLLTSWKAQIDTLSASSTDAELEAALSTSKTVIAVATSLLDDMFIAINSISKDSDASSAAVLNGWKAIVTGAKTSLSVEVSLVTSADTALKNSLSSQGTSADASISSAIAGVASLEAELAKTIIVSPISGKVAALPLHVGELASPGTLLATVVGNGGLQVKAYASSEDIARIAKGASVLINNSVAGTVAAVAPSVSSINKKVEVTIAVTERDSSSLVIGQSVSVSIKSVAAALYAQDSSASYFLPIQDVKIIPGEASVFTIDSDSKVVKHSVILGSVAGDFVEVKSGLTPDMQLVTPVYELQEGQVVDVR